MIQGMGFSCTRYANIVISLQIIDLLDGLQLYKRCTQYEIVDTVFNYLRNAFFLYWI